MDPGRETLTFDGSQGLCFHKAVPSNPVFDPSKIPDSYIISPIDFPQNDSVNLAKTQTLNAQLPRGLYVPPAPGSCSMNPPGFVCGPLPAANGSLVKCVPRMDQSDLNQLSARVLPLSVNRANGSLDNPARPDPRFSLFPNDYPPAYSRCCMGNLSAPVDVQPMSCGAESIPGMKNRLVPEQHKVDPIDLGFRSNPGLMAQLKATKAQADAKRMQQIGLAKSRSKIWKLETQNIKTWKMDKSFAILPLSRRNQIINFL